MGKSNDACSIFHVTSTAQPGIAFADRSHPDKRLVSEFSPLQYQPTVGWRDAWSTPRLASAALRLARLP